MGGKKIQTRIKRDQRQMETRTGAEYSGGVLLAIGELIPEY